MAGHYDASSPDDEQPLPSVFKPFEGLDNLLKPGKDEPKSG